MKHWPFERWLLAAGGVSIWTLVLFSQPPAQAKASAARTAHQGQVVVFTHYHWGYEGQTRAAVLLENPHDCPPEEPNGLTQCANLRYFTVTPSETENPPITGSDWRCCVPHDPTGKTPRSWHVWGEAHGEE